jgi:hypothetical protein
VPLLVVVSAGCSESDKQEPTSGDDASTPVVKTAEPAASTQMQAKKPVADPAKPEASKPEPAKEPVEKPAPSSAEPSAASSSAPTSSAIPPESSAMEDDYGDDQEEDYGDDQDDQGEEFADDYAGQASLIEYGDDAAQGENASPFGYSTQEPKASPMPNSSGAGDEPEEKNVFNDPELNRKRLMQLLGVLKKEYAKHKSYTADIVIERNSSAGGGGPSFKGKGSGFLEVYRKGDIMLERMEHISTVTLQAGKDTQQYTQSMLTVIDETHQYILYGERGQQGVNQYPRMVERTLGPERLDGMEDTHTPRVRRAATPSGGE